MILFIYLFSLLKLFYHLICCILLQLHSSAKSSRRPDADPIEFIEFVGYGHHDIYQSERLPGIVRYGTFVSLPNCQLHFRGASWVDIGDAEENITSKYNFAHS